MKNLFDYATKELSQDAFLCWLFANYDEADLSSLVKELLTEFCDLSPDEIILNVEVWRQWRKIDIWYVIKTTQREKIHLLVEDKTSSIEHNQLENYNKHANAYENVYKVFYKTSPVYNEEKHRVEEAGWKLYDIESIYPIFEKYLNSSNLILKQYVEYLKKIYCACKNTNKPNNNSGYIDQLAWQSYFNRVVLPQLKGANIDYYCNVWRSGRYPYVYLAITKAGYNKTVPYLEIRSCDCCNDMFLARILCYGMDKKDISQQQNLIEKIKLQKEFVCKGLRRHKQDEADYYPKQVGCSPYGLTATDDEQFIALAEKHIALYLQIMQDWV